MKNFILLFLCGIIVSCQKNTSTISSTPNVSTTILKSEDAKAPFKVVKIGTQKWMASNLNVNHYRNGDVIPQVKNPDEWDTLTTGAWCWCNNDPATGAVYGRLYNWYAVNDPRGLAPEGWHIPTKGEWEKLITFAGGTDVAGGVLKDTGTAYWSTPNTGAINTYGFTALPAGYRYTYNGQFYQLGFVAQFWTATEHGKYKGYLAIIQYATNMIEVFSNPNNFGNSVRCVKDKN